MRTIAEFIFDLAQNSVEAGSSTVRITIREDPQENIFELGIEDDGLGMTEEQVKIVCEALGDLLS